VLGAFTLNRICTSILWLLLAVYAKQNYGVSERVYGFIPATNALMVIFFQLLVTRWVSRRKSHYSMVLGALIYAVAIFSVAFGQGFWGFWWCMVFATIGEMILVPTTTTFTSRLAPAEMRARYMSVYALTWGIGTGIGPLLAGLVGDAFGPRSMWYAAGLVGFLGALMFTWLARYSNRPDYIPAVVATNETIS
jgi:MFS family permease